MIQQVGPPAPINIGDDSFNLYPFVDTKPQNDSFTDDKSDLPLYIFRLHPEQIFALSVDTAKQLKNHPIEDVKEIDAAILHNGDLCDLCSMKTDIIIRPRHIKTEIDVSLSNNIENYTEFSSPYYTESKKSDVLLCRFCFQNLCQSVFNAFEEQSSYFVTNSI